MFPCACIPYQSVYDIIIKIVVWMTDLSEAGSYTQEEGLWNNLFALFFPHVFDDYTCELICTLTSCTIAMTP